MQACKLKDTVILLGISRAALEPLAKTGCTLAKSIQGRMACLEPTMAKVCQPVLFDPRGGVAGTEYL